MSINLNEREIMETTRRTHIGKASLVRHTCIAETKKIPINGAIILGDSLTERNEMIGEIRDTADGIVGAAAGKFVTKAASEFIQHGKSPLGRFTNGYTWCDYLSARLADECFIQQSKKKTGKWELDDEKNSDLADAICDGQTEQNFQKSYKLSNSKDVQFQGNPFIVTFAKGGSTARAHYVYESLHVHPDESIKDCVVDYVTKVPSRLVLSTLEEQRKALLAHLAIEEYTEAEKATKLVIEWSGANDLITVDVKPTKIEAKLAVEARIQNVKEMFKNGYRHIVLFNLPDLSLTPRFQRMSEPNKTNAHEVSEYFNVLLLEQAENLQREYQIQYPGCTIEVFDVSKILRDVCENPTQFPEYKFSSDYRNTPYIESGDFKMNNKNLNSNLTKNDAATGYIFWDDVHPTATMHILLAEQLMQKLQKRFEFQMPSPASAERLFKRFKNKYSEMLTAPGWFKLFRQSYLPKDLDGKKPEDAIVKILQHALIDHAERTVSITKELGWIDEDGNIDTQIPALQVASQELRFLKPIDRISNTLMNYK